MKLATLHIAELAVSVDQSFCAPDRASMPIPCMCIRYNT